MGNEFFVEYIQQTDTTLYFLTLEKVAFSLSTKCLSDPTSGSVFIGNYKLGPPLPDKSGTPTVTRNDVAVHFSMDNKSTTNCCSNCQLRIQFISTLTVNCS